MLSRLVEGGSQHPDDAHAIGGLAIVDGIGTLAGVVAAGGVGRHGDEQSGLRLDDAFIAGRFHCTGETAKHIVGAGRQSQSKWSLLRGLPETRGPASRWLSTTRMVGVISRVVSVTPPAMPAWL